MTSTDRAQLLADLALELRAAAGEQPTVRAVTARVHELVPAADAVSVTLRARRHRLVTLAASAELARRADECQHSLQEGPAVEAADGSEWSRSGDVPRDSRWPRWARHAGELGVRSQLSVRLQVDHEPMGSLNLYAAEQEVFADRDQLDLAVLYAAHSAIALSWTREVSGLETALQSRQAIGMAQGILMERYGLDPDRSFELLKRYSSTLNTRVTSVAEEIVATRRLPSKPD